jgi:hypothetical protein
MLSATVMPHPKTVRDLLIDLLGRRVEVHVSEPYGPPASAPATFAVYVGDHLRTAAVAAVDLRLSATLGAAVALIPPGGVETAIEEETLSRTLIANLRGVLAACAGLLNAPGRAHVTLHAVYPPGSMAPSDVPVFAQTRGGRLDLTVSIGGYGEGRLSFVGVG